MCNFNLLYLDKLDNPRMDMYNLIIFWSLKKLGIEVIERYINH